ncbi:MULTISPECIES: phosphopantetheine-binding protein [Cytobacillus]|uniref:phosphopantetheine-binding protein n=1 Tax=Cytobacillus TaxID=2675230 RepID=UPI00135B0E15|nr:phosphopantetheine-binding protein [Cytobacillus sp. AMY 15.2]KAF0815846.1 hypothetical protein KIS4809_5385 [Bacillus sp. ZZV12-4809]MCM3094270.1 phosphopantetheine-binding protein [Cytobacillus sp. AMY 15.2]
MNTSKENLYSAIKEILNETLGSDKEIGIEEDLISVGLDSLNTVSLILDLEEHFDIGFDDNELLTENFSSIEKIATKIIEKTGNKYVAAN